MVEHISDRDHSPSREPPPAIEGGVPEDADLRHGIWQEAQQYVARHALAPPMGMDEIRAHLQPFLSGCPDAEAYPSFALVLLGDAVWRETVAAIPYERRVLMLPQCLRHPEACRGTMDELGLLCAQCGRCAIGDIQELAGALGSVCLVAEGTTVVRQLLLSGKVDAVIGVGCLESLARIFPDMVTHAVPGLGIPLLNDGCVATRVDEAWVSELLRAVSSTSTYIDLDGLRGQVTDWFAPAALAETMGAPESDVARLGQAWLSGAGKRWRPALVAAVYRALKGAQAEVDAVRAIGVAVECFHKASLAHDDIEDGDVRRDDEPTLHARYGVARALNVGDFLLGEGYRLLSEWSGSERQTLRLVTAAAQGHRRLAMGQGEELAWHAAPHALSLGRLLELFALKTAPAFEVALVCGAVCADADDPTCDVLAAFSRALGVGYQIRDDLTDTEGDGGATGDVVGMRPCLPLALACESTDAAVSAALARVWPEQDSAGGPGEGEAAAPDATDAARALLAALQRSGDMERGRQHFAHSRQEAGRILSELDSRALRDLLRRFLNRILGS